MARVDEEGLDLKEINGTQQRPKGPATRWERQRKECVDYFVGWLAFGQPTATAGTAATATATAATTTATAATATATAATDRTAPTGTATAATATATPTTTGLPLAQAAAKRLAATKPIQATKAAPETLRRGLPLLRPRCGAAAKRKAMTSRAPSKQRKKATVTPADLPENTAEDVSDEAMDVVETPSHGVPETAVVTEDAAEPGVTEGKSTARCVPEMASAVPLDDVDLDSFLDAQRRHRLFADADQDDLNVEEDVWTLLLYSDAGGGDETIAWDQARIIVTRVLIDKSRSMDYLVDNHDSRMIAINVIMKWPNASYQWLP
ncbi:hypothetical protein PHYSODRAFT_338647 [Phytophthora sojae]|uniref:Uncharacterized protein n=1 Tax=Phytophthora sojae (strain P6497) TaxID=1094619 RepID=G5A2P7_PHYSP|nr:hypothetical protein PHYSODRAFT_338647 [Phytophthora sojae]EGZ09937.1 hypothetical protein PHYSODRAFT_338647 [Phytophthora sojae]|eukprot:XP_009534798.1 hypothetical protein PHYSODRAFT_338647 [Phytophthora sojae]